MGLGLSLANQLGYDDLSVSGGCQASSPTTQGLGERERIWGLTLWLLLAGTGSVCGSDPGDLWSA